VTALAKTVDRDQRNPRTCWALALALSTPSARQIDKRFKSGDTEERHSPDAPALYARRGWQLPTSIERVYDASRIQRMLPTIFISTIPQRFR